MEATEFRIGVGRGWVSTLRRCWCDVGIVLSRRLRSSGSSDECVVVKEVGDASVWSWTMRYGDSGDARWNRNGCWGYPRVKSDWTSTTVARRQRKRIESGIHIIIVIDVNLFDIPSKSHRITRSL